MPKDEPNRTGLYGLMQASDVRPCSPEASEFAVALADLCAAQVKLDAARQKVPRYLPTCSPEDVVAEEQEEWNRAADRLWKAAHPGVDRVAASVVGGLGCHET